MKDVRVLSILQLTFKYIKCNADRERPRTEIGYMRLIPMSGWHHSVWLIAFLHPQIIAVCMEDRKNIISPLLSLSNGVMVLILWGEDAVSDLRALNCILKPGVRSKPKQKCTDKYFQILCAFLSSRGGSWTGCVAYLTEQYNECRRFEPCELFEDGQCTWHYRNCFCGVNPTHLVRPQC